MKYFQKIGILFLFALIVSVASPAQAVTLAQQLSGRILLQVESRGEAWYVNPVDENRYYMKDGATAYEMLRAFGLGISSTDIVKIPVGIESRFQLRDTDGDGLDDELEKALATSPLTKDTDGDGFNDREEVASNHNPLGPGLLQMDTSLSGKLKGRILLQVQSRGEAWYVNPVDGKRYYMANGDVAYQIMRFLSLGITNANLSMIPAKQLASLPPAPSPVPPPPAPPITQPVKIGNFRDPHTFVFPQKNFSFGSWSLTITPDLALKNSQIRLILTTNDFEKRGNIVEISGDLVQLNANPNTGLGKTEKIAFTNDASGGDEVANDQYFTAQVSSDDWYDTVSLPDISVGYRNGSTEHVAGLIGITFMVFNGTPESMAVFESDHGVGVMPIAYKSAAQAFAQGVDLCYSGHIKQVGNFEYRNGKAYYQMKIGSGYLETGGYVNTITGTSQFFSSINPDNNEWSTCSPITAHELTHSILVDVRKPVWADEGLAEFTAREIVGASTHCDTTGWKENETSLLKPFVSLSQQTWRSDLDHYMSATCAFKYIQDTYGQQAIKNIYSALLNHRSFEVTSYCGAHYSFYQDVIFSNTSVDMKNILMSRFGIPESELSCTAQ